MRSFDVNKPIGSILVLIKKGTGNLVRVPAGALFMYLKPDSHHKFCRVKELYSGIVHDGLRVLGNDNKARFRLAYKNEYKKG